MIPVTSGGTFPAGPGLIRMTGLALSRLMKAAKAVIDLQEINDEWAIDQASDCTLCGVGSRCRFVRHNCAGSGHRTPSRTTHRRPDRDGRRARTRCVAGAEKR